MGDEVVRYVEPVEGQVLDRRNDILTADDIDAAICRIQGGPCEHPVRHNHNGERSKVDLGRIKDVSPR